jgi:hypothetical protein
MEQPVLVIFMLQCTRRMDQTRRKYVLRWTYLIWHAAHVQKTGSGILQMFQARQPASSDISCT